MTTPVTTVTDLEIGQPKSILNLTVVPLSGNPPAQLEYLLLDEALTSNLARVEEISEGGSVPELRLANLSGHVILIVDGTELVGAKQNRIVNASILIPPKSTTKIPVSCVEQGRWRYRTREFRSSKHFAAHRLRKENVDFQKTTLKNRRGYSSDQGKIWSDVSEIAYKVGARSETGALNDVYEQKSSTINDYIKGIQLEGSETGAAFFIGRRLEGVELFDKPGTFGSMFQKLLTGFAVEAMAADLQAKVPTTSNLRGAIKSLLQEIGGALFEKYRAPVGEGEDWRYDGKESFGKALYFKDDLIHLSAFRK